MFAFNKPKNKKAEASLEERKKRMQERNERKIVSEKQKAEEENSQEKIKIAAEALITMQQQKPVGSQTEPEKPILVNTETGDQQATNPPVQH